MGRKNRPLARNDVEAKNPETKQINNSNNSRRICLLAYVYYFCCSFWPLLSLTVSQYYCLSLSPKLEVLASACSFFEVLFCQYYYGLLHHKITSHNFKNSERYTRVSIFRFSPLLPFLTSPKMPNNLLPCYFLVHPLQPVCFQSF